MEQKKGLLPIILLITFSLVLSMWGKRKKLSYNNDHLIKEESGCSEMEFQVQEEYVVWIF